MKPGMGQWSEHSGSAIPVRRQCEAGAGGSMRAAEPTWSAAALRESARPRADSEANGLVGSARFGWARRQFAA